MTIYIKQSKVTGFHCDRSGAMVSFHHPLCPLRNEALTMTRIPAPSLPLKSSDPRNSEVQEETRDMQRADQNNAEIHAKVEYLSGKRLKLRLEFILH